MGGKIMIAYSMDEGRSWSIPEVLIDTPNDDRDPSITQLSNGDILVNYFIVNGEGFESYGLWTIHSADGGHNWSQPSLLSQDYFSSSPIRELSNKELILGLYSYAEKGVYGASVRSVDTGRSWQQAVRIRNREDLDFDAETDIVELNKDSLYAVLRTNDQKRNMHFAISTDHGASWQLSQDIGFPGHCPYLYKTKEGVLFLASRIPDTCIRYSTNNGRTWSKPFIVENSTGGYPSILQSFDGSFLISYYDDSNYSRRAVIKFKRFTFTGNTILFDTQFSSQLR
jgi:Neuraminidase (sialidase)